MDFLVGTFCGIFIGVVLGVLGTAILTKIPWEGSSILPEGSWPEDAKYENGNYHCRCCICGRLFTGHKQRNVCKQCSKYMPKK